MVHPKAQEIQRLEVHGPFVEPLSGIVFPQRVIPWERTGVLQYPEPGGISVDYELREHGVIVAKVTGYVYPQANGMPATLDAHFAMTVEELLSLHPRWQVLGQKQETARGRRGTVPRAAALFSTGGETMQGSPAASAVYLQKEDQCWIKWRSSMPSATLDHVVEQVRGLFDAILAPGAEVRAAVP